MPKQSLQDRVADGYEPFMDDLSDHIAELQRPIEGNVHIKPDERQRRFWQKAKDWPTDPAESRAKELDLMGFNPDGTPKIDEQGNPVKGLTPQDVGLIEYEYREIDAKVFGGYDDDMGQYRYMQKMADLGPPPLDPLEAKARLIEAQQAAAKPEPKPAPDLFKDLVLPPDLYEEAGAGPQAQPDRAVGASMPAPGMAPPPLQPERGY